MGGYILKGLAFAVFGLVMWGVIEFAGFGYRAFGWPFIIAGVSFGLLLAWCFDLYDARRKRREDTETFNHHRE